MLPVRPERLDQDQGRAVQGRVQVHLARLQVPALALALVWALLPVPALLKVRAPPLVRPPEGVVAEARRCRGCRSSSPPTTRSPPTT